MKRLEEPLRFFFCRFGRKAGRRLLGSRTVADVLTTGDALRNLTIEQRSIYNSDFTVYKRFNDSYVSQHKEVSALRAWMRASVEREYNVNAVDPAESISQSYKILKKAAGGPTAGIHRDLKVQYHKLTRGYKRQIFSREICVRHAESRREC